MEKGISEEYYCELRKKRMAFCEVSKYQPGRFSQGIRIFYRTHGHGPIRILLIAGLACTHSFWGPQIEGLTGYVLSNKGEAVEEKHSSHMLKDHDFLDVQRKNNHPTNSNYGDVSFTDSIQVCTFDNRGVGKSTVPSEKSYYTTSTMARDALALLDHLGWNKAHIVGHSMGAMIACKLASIAPGRVCSLALLSVTGGGFQCIPKIDRTVISIFFRFLKAKTPEARAAIDLETHYTKEYLEASVGHVKRRFVLHQEYVKNISASGIQQNYGFNGHINACWTHKIGSKEIEAIRISQIPIAVIHSRHDIIAQIRHARRISKFLQPMARMIELDGGHLITHERTNEVNEILLELVRFSELKMQPVEWKGFSYSKSGHEYALQSSEIANEDSTGFIESCHYITGVMCLILTFVLRLWNYVKNVFLLQERKKIMPIDKHRKTELQDSITEIGK